MGRSLSCKTGRKRAAVRFIALALSVCFVFAFLISSGFVVMYANHRYDGSGPRGRCVTCDQIMSTVSLLQQLFTVIIVTTAAVCYSLSVRPGIKRHRFYTAFCTPVQLKVRLNN